MASVLCSYNRYNQRGKGTILNYGQRVTRVSSVSKVIVMLCVRVYAAVVVVGTSATLV